MAALIVVIVVIVVLSYFIGSWKGVKKGERVNREVHLEKFNLSAKQWLCNKASSYARYDETSESKVFYDTEKLVNDFIDYMNNNE